MPATISSFVSITPASQMQEVVSTLAPDKEIKAPEDIVSLSSNEERERKLFMGDINKFMAEIGKPLSKIPIMGYKELDLFQLFKEVTAYGGFIEVVKNVGTWSKIWKRLGNFDPSITDSSFRLKKNYERYLLDYEYKMFPEHRQQAVDMEKTMQMKKTLHGERPRSPPSNDVAPLPQTRKSLKSSDGAKAKTKKIAKRTPPGYKEVARDKAGLPKMPLNLGDLTVESLGTIVPYAPYVTEKHIWPIGFKSYRYFSSMVNPELRVKYFCQIIDGGDKPQFVVTAEDELDNPITSYSPSAAWRSVLKKVYTKNENEVKKNASASGALRFGLANPIVAQLIRELPNADACKDFSGDYSSSPSSSPTFGRKRRSSSDEDFSDSDEDYEEDTSKKQRLGSYDLDSTPTNSLFTSKKELEDLESAVATLQALKYCTVY